MDHQEGVHYRSLPRDRVGRPDRSLQPAKLQTHSEFLGHRHLAPIEKRPQLQKIPHDVIK